MPDRVAREACERRDVKGDRPAADDAQGKYIVEGQRGVAQDDEHRSERDIAKRLGGERGNHSADVDVAQQMPERDTDAGGEREAERNTEPIAAEFSDDRPRGAARHVRYRPTAMSERSGRCPGQTIRCGNLSFVCNNNVTRWAGKRSRRCRGRHTAET